MKDFRQLAIWQRSHQLTLAIYTLTKRFPRDEQYGLTNQLRRAASSIPANIAEGCGRDTEPELKRFLDIAHGSASEADYHLNPAADLGYLSTEEYYPLAAEIGALKRMIGAFAQKLKADR
ncbi:MAG TPA: four helix bundle protein [Lacunisphaera sp.]|nr:four helix bundle protein [Lacunisphaera sp.]